MNKNEIVKVILNQNLDEENEEDLINLLVKSSISIDIDSEEEKNKTFGNRLADKLTKVAGSWKFIIGFSTFLFSWMLFNGVILTKSLDPFPFILLNLMLSCLAALQAPIIMMSQNRQARKDSLRSQNDYKIDLKSEIILESLYKNINQLLINQNKLEKEIKKLKK